MRRRALEKVERQVEAKQVEARHEVGRQRVEGAIQSCSWNHRRY